MKVTDPLAGRACGYALEGNVLFRYNDFVQIAGEMSLGSVSFQNVVGGCVYGMLCMKVVRIRNTLRAQ